MAHASTVNCVKIGRRSSGVMVTGGDDTRVNMWAIGKPHALLVRRTQTLVADAAATRRPVAGRACARATRQMMWRGVRLRAEPALLTWRVAAELGGAPERCRVRRL